MGIFSKLERKYLPRVNKCLVESNTKPPSAVYDLQDLSSPFFLLGVGVAITFLVFSVEQILYLLMQKKASRKKRVFEFRMVYFWSL